MLFVVFFLTLLFPSTHQFSSLLPIKLHVASQHVRTRRRMNEIQYDARFIPKKKSKKKRNSSTHVSRTLKLLIVTFFLFEIKQHLLRSTAALTKYTEKFTHINNNNHTPALRSFTVRRQEFFSFYVHLEKLLGYLILNKVSRTMNTSASIYICC